MGQRVAEESLISEARVWNEFWALRSDPVFRGEGVLRGNGQMVLVLPGLFGNDLYLQPLRSWLGRIGYKPVMSTLPINAGCPERIKERVARSFSRRLAEYDGDVAIIGHSRGGLLGKALASRLGRRCTCFVALGSPVGAMLRTGREGLAALVAGGQPRGEGVAAEAVVNAGRRAMRVFSPDCEFPTCNCSYVGELLAPLHETTRAYAIYSTDDPVVSPKASPIPGAVNIEVTGTHSGLVVNRAVYRHLGGVLAGSV